MPRRSDRTGLDMGANPFAGEDAHSAYEKLRWGKPVGDAWEIDAPEALFTIGQIAKLYMTDKRVFQWPDDGKSPFLAVGLDSNTLYIVPRTRRGAPVNVPDDWSTASTVGAVKRTDYYADKNDGDAYYYHDHERPYPTLVQHAAGCMLLVPARMRNGRSYIVHTDGIIG